MAYYKIEPTIETLHGYYSLELPPILEIDSGDTVSYRTLDASWGNIDNPNPYKKPQEFPGRDREMDPGLALCGPIAVRGAKAGMTLEIRLKTIRVGYWGWSSGGGYPSEINSRLGLDGGSKLVKRWRIDQNIAENQQGHKIAIHPFMGSLGMPPNEPGKHSTIPPRYCGGNFDCKEIIEGSTVFLPIPVDGGLFSIGDGHAVQGDGEVAGTAIECPMEQVEIEFILHKEMRISYPRVLTPGGWITFGFHENLNEASIIALDGMLDLMVEKYPIERKEALLIASLAVDLRITQIVNGVKGIHAVLHHDIMKNMVA